MELKAQIQAIAKNSSTEAKAQVIVVIGGLQNGDDKAVQARASIAGGNI